MKGGEIKSNLSKEEIIKKAFEFHAKGNISEAQELYQIFISRGFSDIRVYSNYGVIQRKIQTFDFSIKKVTKCRDKPVTTH